MGKIAEKIDAFRGKPPGAETRAQVDSILADVIAQALKRMK